MNKERNLINSSKLYLIPIMFIIIILLRITYAYNDTKQREYEFAKKEAEVLNSYVMIHRNYYQKFFINKTIPLNDETLHALPAFSAAPISQKFSQNNPLNIIVKTVSDRARNPKNMVDKDELVAINYFKQNKNKKSYFSDKNQDFYQYGYPLRIEQKCLTCHGTREEAPKFIRDRYTNAYDYKLGEVRGIISIKLPTKILNNYFFKNFFYSILYDILLLFGLFIFIYYLLKKSKDINDSLELIVKEKTEELIFKNSYLSSYINALNSSSGILKTTPDGIITDINDRFTKNTGYSKKDVVGKKPTIIRHPETSKETIKNIWDTIQSKKLWSGILKGLRKDKSTFITKMTIIPVLDKDNNIIEYIATRTDITTLINNKEKLEHSLVTDDLTLFPNRQKLINDIKEKGQHSSIHLALLNIDRFKDINDFYGHQTADKILIKIAKELKHICENNKTKVYKLPSDEYAILLIQTMNEKEFFTYIEMILKKIMETKLEINDNNIFITFSCGIASNTTSLMIKADMALQIAKEDKEHIIIYNDNLNIAKQITQNIHGISLLKEAIEDDNIVPHFQPIYNIHTKQIEKYECLARIIQKNGFIIAPIKFLEIAKKSKLYPQITKNIITKSFEFFKDKDYEFSINLSIEDILNENTVKFIIKKLEQFTNTQKIVFEILESEKIDNYDELKNFIKKVKKFNCQIAIDDFGSGYSNFAHIYELNIDYLKIDASLVRYITTDINSKKITQTIINFAKDMELKTIAEFVENKDSLDMLEDMGADYIQGYYIGKPQEELNDKY